VKVQQHAGWFPALLLACGMWASPSLLARSVWVEFRNRAPGEDNPVYSRYPQRLGDTNFVAQLYASTAGEDFRPVGARFRMGAGQEAGYWMAPPAMVVDIPIKAGCCADVQVRIWDLRAGDSYEAAAGSPRFASTVIWFFGGERTNVLSNLGYMSLEDFEPPAVTVSPSSAPILRQEGSGAPPVQLSGYVGQLRVGTNSWTPPFDSVDARSTAAGPVAPIADTGPNAGQWDVPWHRIITLPGIPVRSPYHPFAGNSDVQLYFFAWERAFGATFQEARDRGSDIGFGRVEPISVGPLMAWPRERSGPVPVSIRGVELEGRRAIRIAPPGLSLHAVSAAQTQASANALSRLLVEPPDGTTLFLFDRATQSYVVRTVYGRSRNDHDVVSPGQAFFVYNPATQPMVLRLPPGTTPPATQVRPTGRADFIAVGNSTSGSPTFQDLTGLEPKPGDAVFLFESGGWVVHEYEFGGWLPGPFTMAPGDGAFIRLQP